ncbi:MAG TPA: DUF5009 domain-containing protein, partial [Flavisolibacter sp.]|nr:DUF5009 domain-containing protein [Flavisolibacter sp.]
RNVPEWIKHVGRDTDGLGFADTVFPAFLFIVGLSIPFAINNRLEKSGSRFQVLRYITGRALALLVMGFIHVNLEHYSQSALVPKAIWEILVTVSFFLIWMDYPNHINRSKKYILQFTGVAMLVVLCFLFRGESDKHYVGMQPYWWGILGLIGWSYLVCALIFILFKGRLTAIIISLIFFFLFDLSVHAGWIKGADSIRDYVWIVGNGSMPAFTMAGIFIVTLYNRFLSKNKMTYYPILLLFGGLFILVGFLVRPFGGISKIHDTPSWVGICTGISTIMFVLFIWLIDNKQKQAWFKFIMPAGTSTLTCYLIPYILYPIYELVNFHYPSFMNQGVGGLIRSFLIAFIVIRLAGLLEKVHIKIKI